MTECEEIADGIAITMRRRELPTTMKQARAIVRRMMQDETTTIIDNVAEALLQRGTHK